MKKQIRKPNMNDIEGIHYELAEVKNEVERLEERIEDSVCLNRQALTEMKWIKKNYKIS